MKVYQARKNTTTNHSPPSLPSNHATITIRMFCIIAACITSIHARTTTATVTAGKFGLWNKPKYTPSSSSSLPTTTNTSTRTKTTKTTTKTRRYYSPIEIGVQSALHNMFGGGGSSPSSPLSSSSAAAFTRGSMPVVPNYFSKEQQQYTKQTLHNKAAPLNKSLKRKRNASNLNIATSSSSTTTTTTTAPTPLTTKSSTTPTTTTTNTNNTKADASTTTLSFFECMICGAISRSVSQTLTHPADTLKTLLQLPSTPKTKNTLSYYCQPKHLPTLMRGAGAKIILSIPLGAANFAVLEYTKAQLLNLLSSSSSSGFNSQEQNNWQKAGIDFLSSSLSTLSCSILSVPQTVIMDNIMAGRYENLISAVGGIGRGVGENGGMTMMNIKGFYRGWGPSMIKSIPSYGLTWVFFEQLKSLHTHLFHRNLENTDNLLIGCIASAASVCIMIPMDTIKTRLVLLSSSSSSPSPLLQLQTLQKSVVGGSGTNALIVEQQQQQCYNGIIDCASKIIKEEGITALYRGLTPRLMGVVPMIGIQFGVYEFMKRYYIHRKLVEKKEEEKKEEEEEGGVEIGSW